MLDKLYYNWGGGGGGGLINKARTARRGILRGHAHFKARAQYTPVKVS